MPCPESFGLREALSADPLPFSGASTLALEPSADSGHFLGVRALLARFRVPLSLEAASSGLPLTLSCLWETVLVMPGVLATGGASVRIHRDEEATVLRAKLGMVGGTRGMLGALGSSSGLSGSWEVEGQTLFSSGFCLGMFLRGLALGFLSEALGCSGGSFPGRPLTLPLPRGSLGSSVTGPLIWGLLGDVSEVPLTELLRERCVSVLPGVSRGEPLDGGSGLFQPPAPLMDLEMGTTLRMC